VPFLLFILNGICLIEAGTLSLCSGIFVAIVCLGYLR